MREDQERNPAARSSARWFGVVASVLLAVAAGSACSRTVEAPLPTAVVPTQAATSTPLPPFPTLASAGDEEASLVIVLVSSTGSAADTLSAALTHDAGISVEVRFTDSLHEAYAALCDGSAAAASLDAFAYLAAREAGCGEALYQAEIGGETAAQSQFVTLPTRIYSVENFVDRVFCRSEGASAAGWIVPLLTLQVNGINTVTGLADVLDAGDDAGVLALLLDGTCDVGVTALGAENSLGDPAAVAVRLTTTPVPFDVLAVSGAVEGQTRTALLDALRQNRGALAGAVGVDALLPADESRFADLEALLEEAGVDVLALSR